MKLTWESPAPKWGIREGWGRMDWGPLCTPNTKFKFPVYRLNTGGGAAKGAGAHGLAPYVRQIRNLRFPYIETTSLNPHLSHDFVRDPQPMRVEPRRLAVRTYKQIHKRPGVKYSPQLTS